MNKFTIPIVSFLSLITLTLLLPAVSIAAPCTAGVDCYCDKVRNSSSPFYDSSLLFCEDFEAPTLAINQGVGNGPPYYGPWYDDTGMRGNRGNNSYWYRKYGNGVNSFLFSSGQPSNPTYGSPCSYPLCTGAKVWDSLNRWSANSLSPLLAIYTKAADFSTENSAISAPGNKAGGGTGVFDGNANLVHRIGPGATGGIAGEVSFPTTRNIGYTSAIAYPSNSDSSGIWGTASIPGAWKHNEWATVYNPNGGWDGLFIFYNQEGPRDGRPFAGFLGSFRNQTVNCSSIVVRVGKASCINGNIGIYWNTPTGYSQPTDWPWGTWGCVRGFIENAGLPTMRMRVWFQGPNMTSERLIIDFSADGSPLDNRNGYNGMKWNAYANTNQGTGYTPTTTLTFRYEDNLHVRNGMPVSCAQIGFTGTGGSTGGTLTPPTAPTNLTVN